MYNDGMQILGKTVYFSPGTATKVLREGLKAARDSHWVLNGGIPSAKTKALREGVLIDRLVFNEGPEIVELPFTWWSPEARKQRDEIEKGYAIAHLPHEIAQAEFVGAAIGDELAYEIGADYEAQVKRTYVEDDVDCKVKLDVLTTDLIVDVKSTSAMSESELLEACWKYRYDVQAAAYLEAFPRRKFRFLFANKKTADCTWINLPIDALARGTVDWRMARKLWKDCLETNNWEESDNA